MRLRFDRQLSQVQEQTSPGIAICPCKQGPPKRRFLSCRNQRQTKKAIAVLPCAEMRQGAAIISGFEPQWHQPEPLAISFEDQQTHLAGRIERSQ